MERTFLMIKPDGVQRGLIGEIVKRFELKGFQLHACKLVRVKKEQAEKHYEELKDKPFFGELVQFITAGPVFAMVWAGDEVVSLSRSMMGKTKVLESQPGTIRGDYALHTGTNIIHGSDSPASAEREIANFFAPDEIVDYDKIIQRWM
ncbi:nucleoside diphosphate kinase [Paenibacillus swuensis]|uniref:Nucleoside diphosphate kinase n=1 Tax=Paenibacillus swuensis TaxID=1178515 RepID=A0A172TLF4_9BACL|nr:nucleoside-diphosphate kinase [Paenibacillus swuensis]ANE47812.1 nucleoside diphosphate kinase [Paenibacillus swuensis]